MPIYEYVCERDGTRLELLRPMSQADAPVEDPEGKGRVFTRVHSTFAATGSREASAAGPGGGGKHVHVGGCCPCGKPGGGCGGRI
ncbi:MAG: FmdB family zinc ribbon protein [Planctomycetota bacterium]|nr:FmdB family zinc ribbon protein [Planctomycetota bacterium]